ncbi:Flagellum-specific peptidoglycan hydrolase FlgJ [Flavobacterium caeni]|uniref:Peptidoglycan hydrolase n=2 Tax=Flavobacterium caeni TaxID=490189 RepID=A0A1G5J3G1_9FLAO|nr:Flagellum-specific peptidoglycan hydrolase FlgJ [Flavobacterium caeni]
MLLLTALLVVACNSSQPVVRTKKPVNRKPNTSVSSRSNAKKPYKKPAPENRRVTPNKPVASRTGQNGDLQKIGEKYEAAKEKSSGNSTVYSKEEILEATTRVKVTTAMVYDYIDTYKGIAQNNMTQYGIPASITLGQGILESGSGTGPLSVLANNHFGIKCHKEWTGPSVRYDDDEEQECFRQYEHPSESYRDHSQFLTTRTRYAGLFLLDKDDYKAWAKGLKAAGYATDPKYPDKLIGIIERYQLAKYDAEVLGTEYVSTGKEPSILEAGRDNAVADSDLYQVIQGDTLYSISKKFNISVDDLRRKNNIIDNAISIGQSLKVK